MTESASLDQTLQNAAREKERRSRKLFGLGTAAMGVLLAYYIVTANVQDPLHLYQALGMILLATLPSLFWARRGSDRLPVFEVLMLTTMNTYALPLLNGHAELRNYTAGVITQSGFAVLLFQSIAVITHAIIPGRPGKTPFFTEEIITRDIHKYISYGLALSTIYTFFYVFHNELIPYEINSVLRAVFYGVGLVSTFVQARRWGQNDLSTNDRIVFAALLSAQILMQVSTLFLVGGVSVMILALVGYVAGSRRIPIVPSMVLLAAIALLHNGKSVMREKYWDEDDRHEQVGLSELLSFYAEWLQAGLTVKQSSGEQELTKKLFERTSLFHIMCLVVSYTPERLPFLEGETYAQIPGQFVPRFFWPEKPRGHISTYTLAIYYGLQSEEGTAKTTIGFGLVTEAYANYGFIGVGSLAFVLGAFYKKIQVLAANSPLLSYPGLFLIVLMAWSFQTEHTLSIWLTSMFQACVGVIGLPFIIRNLAG